MATLLIAGVVLLTSGAGRIAVGAHWPTDVLGGYLFGSLGVISLVWCWRYGSEMASTFTPHLVPVSFHTAPDVVPGGSEKTNAVGTIVLRRRIGTVALGGLLAAMIVYAAGAASPLAQSPATTGEYATRIITGRCADTSAATAYDLKSVSLTGSDDDDNDNDEAPNGNAFGAAGAVPVAASGTNLNVSLDTLTAQPHAIVVTSGAADAPVIACGDIDGQLRGDNDLVIGLAPTGDTGAAGLAFLDGDNETDVTVYLISWN